MNDIKSLAWLLPIAGLLILFGWFFGRVAGWDLEELDVGIDTLKRPTATVAPQIMQPSHIYFITTIKRP
ncbi:hypothetical protein [Rosettibacter firmus]|uniref:hypothetical protein n=1 Tax=Rosettibacter firmus TaxID=3111522 RepID=UPI00336BED1A